jgi:iron-sulfur cluster assembly protein
VVALTDSARAQIRRVLAKKGDPAAFLRLGVRGGGCSGLSYVMKPDTDFDPDFDRTWEEKGGPRIVVDHKSITFLRGATLDYSMKNLLDGGFKFDNPNATKSCGCGTSFTPK